MIKVLTITIIGIFAMTLTTGAFAQTASDTSAGCEMLGDMLEDPSSITGTVSIGALHPLSGDLSSIGEQLKLSTELAVEDFNRCLESNGAEWSLELVVEDTMTTPAVALEKAQTLHARGVELIVGPATSDNAGQVLGYANANDLLLVSCCSTTPVLALTDNLLRLVPNDSNQGVAIGKLLTNEGIEAIVPIWRGDSYGDGLFWAVEQDFTNRGGVVYDTVRYNPAVATVGLEVDLLNRHVESAIGVHGADKVAVLMISFDEGVRIMQSASEYESLADVRWFGSESLSENTGLIEDPIVSEFVDAVNLHTVQFLVSPGDVHNNVKDRIEAVTGSAPISFVYPAYDAVWLIGMAAEKASSTSTQDIKGVIHEVAATYSGAMRGTTMNEHGDLESADYQIWTLQDSTWTKLGQFVKKYDIITAANQPTGDVTIGSIYPLTGDLSARGPHRLASSQLGVDDFNTLLESLSLDWKLQLLSEDSETKATVAFDKTQVLNAKGVNFIIGIPASANVKNIKSYVDTSNMLVLSCCSTAPSLAIAGDNIFRVAPDDATQARVLAKLMEISGIEGLVIIYRGDDYGDGLADHTEESFAQFGTVGGKLRYNPETADYSGEVSLLAEHVQKLVDTYGADKVAVLMIAYDESVNIVQGASSYDILDDVRWFGSETFVGVSYFAEDRIADEFINSVDFTALFVSDEGNEGDAHQRVVKNIQDKFGTDPASYVDQAYDAAWLIGLSILVSGNDDTLAVKAALPSVASTYTGALASTEMNENGDLVPLDLQVWQVIDSEWASQGTYSLSTNTIIP